MLLNASFKALIRRMNSSTISEINESRLLKRALRLTGKVQAYQWGKIGEASRIATMLRGALPEGRLAEYWLGGHPKGCSDVELPDGASIPLNSLVARYPELLGDRGMGAGLPFILKVLSIDPAVGLSIQAHPDSDWAQRLHFSDPLNYPDASHKPEIGIPLTPVTLLYGFRSVHELRESLAMFPELGVILSPTLLHEIESKISTRSQEDIRRELYASLLNTPRGAVEEVVRIIIARFAATAPWPVEIEVIDRLRRCYGDGDVGLLAVFVMNLVTVFPGKAIFIGPNIPHAYLEGDLIECMACSDNVVRAGLTPKFKDVETLLEMLDYSVGMPALIEPQELDDGFFLIPANVREFQISLLPCGSGVTTIESGKDVAILLCLGAHATIRMIDGKEEIDLIDGGAVLLPPRSGRYEIKRTNASIYRVVAEEHGSHL